MDVKISNATFKARVTKEVNLTKEEYVQYLTERKEMYIRLIKEEDKRLARSKAKWSKTVDDYESKVKSLDNEIKELK